VPRGILESACEWDYEETLPELVQARDREIVVVCRSGYRSVLAAHSMQVLGYSNVASLQTGLRGWKDYDQPLVDGDGNDVDLDDADVYFTPKLRPEQQRPKGHCWAAAPVEQRRWQRAVDQLRLELAAKLHAPARRTEDDRRAEDGPVQAARLQCLLRRSFVVW
jgi:hypothetical protein